MQKFRKKPVVIEARVAEQEEIIHTLEGDMKANAGDYIITGVKGEQYPCKPDIFEATYDVVHEGIPEELKDTVDGMQSVDYKERFKAEYFQTSIRYNKLRHFCDLIEAAEYYGTDVVKHDCPLGLLREQQKQMGLYLHCLELRAVIEKIDLN